MCVLPLTRRLRLVRQGFEQSGIVQNLRDQFFRPRLAVHVGDQVGELRARLEELAERTDLASHRGGRKSSMLSNVMSTLSEPSPVRVLAP